MDNHAKERHGGVLAPKSTATYGVSGLMPRRWKTAMMGQHLNKLEKGVDD